MAQLDKCLAGLLILACMEMAAQGRSITVNVRVFDGPTGLPADAKKVHLFCRMTDGSVCPIMRRLETKAERREGISRFEVSEGAATIYQYGTGAAECNFDPTLSPGAGGYALFNAVSFAKIEAEGVLFQDKCKTDKTVSSPEVHPGELVVFYTGGYTTKSVVKGLLVGH